MPPVSGLQVQLNYLGVDSPWNEIERFAAEECARMEYALRSIAVKNEPNPAEIVWKFSDDK